MKESLERIDAAIYKIENARLRMGDASSQLREGGKALGEGLRSWRAEQGITLREAAREFKISPAYLSDIELGRRTAGVHTLAKLKGFLERSVA